MRLILIILSAALISILPAAEIRDGRLWLDVLITEGTQVSFETTGQYTISEMNAPIAATYTGKSQLQINTADQQLMWGIINRTEPILSDTTKIEEADYIRTRFIWKMGKLVLLKERVVFEDQYFKTKILAKSYANETGYSDKQLSAIPMQEARLKVNPGSTEAHYFQLPVTVVSSNPVYFNGQSFNYSGSFIIRENQGKLIVSNLIDLETYVAGVVPNEIGNNAPEEALKAQAVAARTHALSLLLMNRHIQDGYDLCDGTHCQVYKGSYLRDANVVKAVSENADTVMFCAGAIADAVYHSSCGGKTESNQNAWSGKAIPYLQGMACYAELDSLDLTEESNAVTWLEKKPDVNGMSSWEKKSEMWDRSLSRNQLSSNCGVSGLHTLQIIKRGNSGRILKLKLIGENIVYLNGEWEIRQKFGNLPSSFFYVTNSKNSGSDVYALSETILLKGKGFGHGVGMCQVGALQKARSGWKWKDILQSYYPGTYFSADWLQNNSNSSLDGD